MRSGLPHRVQHAGRRIDVVLLVRRSGSSRPVDAREGGQMDDRVDASQQRADRGAAQVDDVLFDVVKRCEFVLAPSLVTSGVELGAKPIDSDHPIAVGEQLAGNVAADETG